ncbi:DMT family transporter [Clostridium formicaceticum]|uniref:EamA-like transporter family protein n=1 Tax=Clostridium formicaceticum TaxID=1497 RepID=A0AAC9WIC5_9CLOT|nr:DMT family transporter [Clostridium formicaceticum]AOY75208.1 hypothetical protein BJL90_04395 [Clostridium formicaceticum]ARE89639.1 hypothetical protein CLFO_41200 [Clostridium formicaceticum]
MKTNWMAIIIGGLIAVMIHMNGTLASYTNTYFSSLIVHFIGALGVAVLLFIIEEEQNKELYFPSYYYLGGVLGALIIVLNNVSFKGLGVSITVALVFLGQMVTSICIDNFGMFRMKKIPFNKKRIPGIFLVFLGVIIMILA